MPPRQPIMPKRTSYYAPQREQNEKSTKKGVPDGSFERSDKVKMPFRPFPVVLEKIFFFEKKLVDIGLR